MSPTWSSASAGRYFLCLPLPKSVPVQILTDKVQAPDSCNLLMKLRKEGWHVRVHATKEFHDRYIRVDGECWHSGHSLKDLGSKDSRLSKVNDSTVIATLDKRIADALQAATEICP